MGWNDEWSVGVGYSSGDIRRHESNVYKAKSDVSRNFIYPDSADGCTNPENAIDGSLTTYASLSKSQSSGMGILIEKLWGYFSSAKDLDAVLCTVEYSTEITGDDYSYSCDYDLFVRNGSTTYNLTNFTPPEDTKTEISISSISTDSVTSMACNTGISVNVGTGDSITLNSKIYDFKGEIYNPPPPDDPTHWQKLTGGHSCNF